MRKSQLSVSLLIALGMSSASFAENSFITVSGVIPGFVPIYSKTTSNKIAAMPSVITQKPILFQKITLSPAAMKYLANNIENVQNQNSMMALAAFKPSDNLPTQNNVGMNNVPVLDQGAHGACVTFAATGAVDAAYGKGDYISQLCSLELGSYLNKKDPQYYSGWDGSTADVVMKQLQTYGIISKSYQTTYGCAGVKDYPVDDQSNEGKAMNTSEFARHSESIMSTITRKNIFDLNSSLSSGKKVDMDAQLNNVKQSVTNGHRVIFGTFIVEKFATNGAAGNYHNKANDAWVLSSDIGNYFKQHKNDRNNTVIGGHEMIIIGYDDNATVTDTLNQKHTGVLTLRNSWGGDAGDQGTYYMSYDYFKTMVTGADEIY